jgi:hypothetical protein
MANAIIIAVLAALASAMLTAAGAALGPGLGALFVAISPLPLMIVAIGLQPLVAVAGGAIVAAALAFMLSGSRAISFAIVVMLPAYLAGFAIHRSHPDRRMLIGILALGACAYAACLMLFNALSVSFDFATLESQLQRAGEGFVRFLQRLAPDAPLVGQRGEDLTPLARAMAAALLPIGALGMAVIYLVNVWLAAKIAHRSNPDSFAWTPVYMMTMPRWLLPASGGLLLVGMTSGYSGLVAELFAIAAIVALVALGYAAAHHAMLGNDMRGAALTGLWTLTFVLTPVAILLMLMAGIAELAFGWREKIVAQRNT